MSYQNLEEYLVKRSYFDQGGLWGWGYNNYGQLGTTTIGTGTSSPVQTFAGGTNWKSVSCGGYNSAAIKTDGTLWTWGLNLYGQLGNNDSGVGERSSPIQTVSGGTDWKAVAGGDNHMTAIKTDGTLWTWGFNTSGQLGTNDITHRSSPIQTVSGGTDWKQVSAGRSHTATIKNNGELWTFGDNTYGQLGDSSLLHKSSPIQTIAGGTNWKSVICGGYHTTAIKTDGTLWVWGENASGQLGVGDVAIRSSPVQTVAGGNDWKSVGAGYANTAAIKTNGELWNWGRNDYGQLGTNDRTSRSSPIQTVAGGNDWKSVDVGVGGLHTVALKLNGEVWNWGYNLVGCLGDNSVAPKSSPVQTVAGGTNWKMVVCGDAHTMAINESWGIVT
jgi:alpha-tubulin suppressor-like RCC1 family protein